MNFNTHFKSYNNDGSPLTIDQLKGAAPAIFAESASSKVSARYSFIPTTKVIEAFAADGWLPCLAKQSRSRIDGKDLHTTHVIRFRQDGVSARLGEFLPEIVLTNNHLGTAGYKCQLGLFRLACFNGLVTSSAVFGSVSLRHSGDIASQVIDVSSRVISSIPLVADTVKRWQSVELTTGQQAAFGARALLTRWDSLQEAPIGANRIIASRRYTDSKNDLWSVYNRAQENLVQGGIRYRNPENYRNASTRAINSVQEDISVNKQLWELAEEFSVGHELALAN